jgi:hypothetical protein
MPCDFPEGFDPDCWISPGYVTMMSQECLQQIKDGCTIYDCSELEQCRVDLENCHEDLDYYNDIVEALENKLWRCETEAITSGSDTTRSVKNQLGFGPLFEVGSGDDELNYSLIVSFRRTNWQWKNMKFEALAVWEQVDEDGGGATTYDVSIPDDHPNQHGNGHHSHDVSYTHAYAWSADSDRYWIGGKVNWEF